MLKRVQPVRIFDQTVEQMRNAILEGQYPLGGRLPTEQELCEIMQVSRSTIRESIRVLEAEGLVEVRQGMGTYVSEKLDNLATRGEIMSWLAKREESMIQILQVREGIEWLTAGLAAANQSDELIETLQEVVDKQMAEAEKSQDESNIIALAGLDVQFHLLISRASGNDIAHEIISQIVPAFSEANRAVLWVGKQTEYSIQEHQNILDAIIIGDQSGAEKAMRGHIARVRKEICAYLDEACPD